MFICRIKWRINYLFANLKYYIINDGNLTEKLRITPISIHTIIIFYALIIHDGVPFSFAVYHARRALTNFRVYAISAGRYAGKEEKQEENIFFGMQLISLYPVSFFFVRFLHNLLISSDGTLVIPCENTDLRLELCKLALVSGVRARALRIDSTDKFYLPVRSVA